MQQSSHLLGGLENIPLAQEGLVGKNGGDCHHYGIIRKLEGFELF